MGKFFKVITNRAVIAGLIVLVQIFFLLYGVLSISNKATYLDVIFTIISIAVVLYIINNSQNPSYKLAWIIPILIFPVFGGLLYLVFGGHRLSKKTRKQAEQAIEKTSHLLVQEQAILDEIAAENPHIHHQVSYLARPLIQAPTDPLLTNSVFPVYKGTETSYFSSGEKFFEELLKRIEAAEHFIFMEYFIIQEGYMWNSILALLERKAAEGVDVRIIYDDFGCVMKLPARYISKLNSKGIKCRVFNPIGVQALKLPLMNNRDHRKITVIDGYIGFNGGLNLADEYINYTSPCGHWKDAAVMIKGEAVWSLTTMFLQMWNLCGSLEEFDYDSYRPHAHHPEPFTDDGYVLPYSDTPFDNEEQGEMVYLNMINKAKKYIYITTPYLIIDHSLKTSLILAAANGVDVRIITPHKYDKALVHMCTQSNYTDLVKHGVKIYEYEPGFIHAKNFVSDDETAIVGTINLDYRSLYFQLECATFMYGSSAVKEIKQDFVDTLDKCIEITDEFFRNRSLVERLFRAVVNVFSPLF